MDAGVQIASGALPRGTVVAIELAGADFVLWRGDDGVVRGAPRWCPHLDHDLADGYVVDRELVCAGHGWAFDGAGHTYKRNEFGRIDPKGRVPMPTVTERNGIIESSPADDAP